MELGALLYVARHALPLILRPHHVPVPSAEHGEIFIRQLVLTGWLKALVASRAATDAFHEVSAFCFFLASPRSGHSLFGALLDAHPNVVVAHELDALPLVGAGYSRNQLFWAILDNSRRFAACGRGWSGYSYAVPGQWQGRFQRLRVIGDKKGGASSRYLARGNPNAIEVLRHRVGVPLRVFFYYRNPFDVLATMAQRAARTEVTMGAARAEIRRFGTMERAREELADSERFDVYHERFLTSARETLRAAIEFVGEEASASYLDDATSIVRESPARSRTRVPFAPGVIEYVEREIRRLPPLMHYAFDSD
ncbi:MAG TPA: sulfotransferase [Methylomirabilota bacterium]